MLTLCVRFLTCYAVYQHNKLGNNWCPNPLALRSELMCDSVRERCYSVTSDVLLVFNCVAFVKTISVVNIF
jgi:hypothetical protein